MTKLNKKTARTIGIVVTLILVAYVFRFSDIRSYHSDLPGLIRAFIYLGLYMAWGVSFRDRIIQTQARRYLTAIASLMVFWFVVRTLKYHFVSQTLQPDITRYLWYMYYLAMLFIPLLAVFVAMSIGKPEEYRLQKQTALLYIPATVLFMLVITNDLHQLVFTFPESATVWADSDYGYAIVSYIIVGWQILCALVMLVVMYVKCRIPGRRKQILLPCVPICVLLIYMGFYCSGSEWFSLFFGDMTAMNCLMYAATLEICIQCGFIQNNTGYDDLFEACTFGAQITDKQYRTRYASLLAPKLPKELMQEAEEFPVQLDKNTQVKISKIPGGNVLWKEDITELTAVIEDLEDIGRELSERNYLAQENYKTKRRISTLREKNRLIDLLQHQTAPQIDILDRLFLQYENETDEAVRRRLLAMTAVVGSYIKRCGNLLFISENGETTDISELTRCLDESFSNLELLGVSCGHDLPQNGTVRVTDAIRAYRIFEKVIETAMENLDSVWLKGRNTDTNIILHLEVECKTDLSELSDLADGFTSEDGAYCFTIRIGKGGEQV